MATYAGVPIIDAEMVHTHGVAPSVCVMRVIPSDDWSNGGVGLPNQGDLSFGDDRVNEVLFRDCVVKSANFVKSESEDIPHLWEVVLLDRRARWAGVRIDGHYNVHDGEGLLSIPRRPKTGDPTDYSWSASDLAAHLLDKLGETGYTITGLPDDYYPEYSFVQTPVVSALADLLDMCGCRLALGLDNTVRIFGLNEGGDVPDRDDATHIPHPYRGLFPSEIEFVCEPTIYHGLLKLLPVNFINNTELSYRGYGNIQGSTYADGPATEFAGPYGYQTVVDRSEYDIYSYQRLSFGTMNHLEHMRLYKVYWLEGAYGQDGKETQLLPELSIERSEDIVPMPYQASSVRDEVGEIYGDVYATYTDKGKSSGGLVNETARVFGSFHNNGVAALWRRKEWGHLYSGRFEYLPGSGLVKFDEPVYSLIAFPSRGSSYSRAVIAGPPAHLSILTGFMLKDAQGQLKRYRESRRLDFGQDFGQYKATVQLKNTRRFLRIQYNNRDEPFPRIFGYLKDNLQFVKNTIQNLLDHYESAYRAGLYNVTYVGIVPIETTGLVHEVIYRSTGNVVETVASRGFEYDSGSPGFRTSEEKLTRFLREFS